MYSRSSYAELRRSSLAREESGRGGRDGGAGGDERGKTSRQGLEIRATCSTGTIDFPAFEILWNTFSLRKTFECSKVKKMPLAYRPSKEVFVGRTSFPAPSKLIIESSPSRAKESRVESSEIGPRSHVESFSRRLYLVRSGIVQEERRGLLKLVFALRIPTHPSQHTHSFLLPVWISAQPSSAIRVGS